MGRLFVIKTNLCECLVHALGSNERSSPYWVDAICIDQNKLEEKAIQVSMMGDIYRHTELCIVWLGPEGR